jgi:hypothetical protein
MGIARRMKKYHRKDWLLIRYREFLELYRALTSIHLGD